jgi:hypothetical protein
VAPTNLTVTNGGGPANFYASAIGTAPLSYSWQLSGVTLTNGPSFSGSGAVISGVTTSNLTITGYTLADNGENYAVVAANAYGTNTASAVLSVLPNTLVSTMIGGISVSGTQFVFSYATVAGQTYQVEVATNLAGVWLPAGGSVQGTGSVVSATNSISSTGQQFFRLSITP